MSQTKSEHFTTRSEVYSTSTRRSVKSETIAIARAKAQSAKVKADFAVKEAKIKAAFAEKEIKAAAEMQLKLEKLRMETALEELAAEKESAAAAAEADILEELAKPTSERLSNVLERKSVPDDGTERTSEYVRRHAEPDNCPLTAPRAESTPAIHMPYVKQESKPALSQFSAHSAARLSKHYVTVDQIENEERRVKRHSDCISDDRKYPPSSWHNRAPPGYSHNNQGMSDFFKFLARRELLAKGLAKFNDRPESYRAWRSSFRNATRDLELNASEEADLLVNWLGNESSEHARRIRDININYPSRGLSMIWERVDECYGSPEVIENSLFKRIDDFPRIPNKGYQKLRELSDLVTELQIAKAEGDLPGLAFLDTARGVNSIVQKLPYSLQETWISRGSKYKLPTILLFCGLYSLSSKARSFKRTPTRPSCFKGWHYCHKPYTVDELTEAKNVIIRCVQQETYAVTLECLQNRKNIPKNCPLRKLNPFIDNEGLLRVGGRISNAGLDSGESNPIIIPNNHVASLLVEFYHTQIKHQGRLFTEGALRAAGLWIVGAKRLVSKTIFKCITCRKLRGMFQTQKMANLPADRLSTEPPFTNVGLDVFGPWAVITRQTRGGSANSKRWAVMFTCMCIRAVHIEVTESLDTSSFINALRRFISIRGPVKHIRSDRGTNFVGACKELNITSNLHTERVERYLSEQGCTWTFNPPHSSHMGGAWERMIGIARRILDSMFLHLGTSKLTHETLTTFMAEVSACDRRQILEELDILTIKCDQII
ncbi:uncharacterized protein [Aquarana catesbeiana]|uniref:uncharacterized protein n=1 Tax=Aquarana catesbeiana TaxID=8400 RepID=UPI003CC955FB